LAIIHEAFVKNGTAFADREEFYVEKAVANPHSKGGYKIPWSSINICYTLVMPSYRKGKLTQNIEIGI
jgi:hypothetical protein